MTNVPSNREYSPEHDIFLTLLLTLPPVHTFVCALEASGYYLLILCMLNIAAGLTSTLAVMSQIVHIDLSLKTNFSVS